MFKVHIEENINVQKESTPAPSAAGTESARPVH